MCFVTLKFYGYSFSFLDRFQVPNRFIYNNNQNSDMFLCVKSDSYFVLIKQLLPFDAYFVLFKFIIRCALLIDLCTKSIEFFFSKADIDTVSYSINVNLIGLK